MDKRKRFDDLVTECTWSVMQGITEGTLLSRLVRNVMQATIEWKNDLDAGSPAKETPGLLDHMRRLNETVVAKCDKLAQENEQLKANLAEKSAEVMKFAGDVVRLEKVVQDQERTITMMRHEAEGLREAPERIKTEMNALIQQIAEQRDSQKLRGDMVFAKLSDTEAALERLKQERDAQELRADDNFETAGKIQDRVKVLEQQLDKEVSERGKLAQLYAVARQQNIDQRAEIGRLEYRLGEVAAERDKLNEACAMREQAIDVLRKERDEALELPKKLQRKYDRLRATFKGIRGYVAAFNDDDAQKD